MFWRALLTDGSRVDYNGDNTPQAFLDAIVCFDVHLADGTLVERVGPLDHECLIFRWDRSFTLSGDRGLLGVKVGVFNRDSGELRIGHIAPDGTKSAPQTGTELTPLEITALRAEVHVLGR